jgi:hypothetical protein
VDIKLLATPSKKNDPSPGKSYQRDGRISVAMNASPFLLASEKDANVNPFNPDSTKLQTSSLADTPSRKKGESFKMQRTSFIGDSK